MNLRDAVQLAESKREDVRKSEGRKTTLEQRQTSNAQTNEEDWQEPEPLPDDLLPVPSLSPNLLPRALRDWLVDVADRMQCPLEFPSIAAIVLGAALVGNRIRIRPKRIDVWTVVANLWGAIVGKPGLLKTPALEESLKPLKARERIARDEYAEAMKNYEFNQICAAAQRKQLESDVKEAIKKKKDTTLLQSRLADTQIQEPTERRYIVNDPTVEKLGQLLNQNPRGLLLFRDELVGWLKSLDKQGHEQDRTFYLEAWNGSGSYTYDRISRGTLRIDNLTLSILGGIQPGPLRQYLYGALSGSYNDDGLIQRFQLLVYPDPSKRWRNVDREPDRKAAALAHECFAKLDMLEPANIGAIKAESETAQSYETEEAEACNENTYHYLRFDNEAQDFFDLWRGDLENSLRDGSLEHAALEAHLAKYRSLMPALALIFHLLGVVSGEPSGAVSLESAQRAAAWCSFLESHAKRIYGMAVSNEVKQAKIILEKIKLGQIPPAFTARDIYRKGWAGFTKPSDVVEPLQILSEYGWLRSFQIISQDTQGRGRPSLNYVAHPSLVSDVSESEVEE